MPLLEYIVKLLAGNSASLFVGIIILIFGYYGWLLWNMNEMLKKYFSGRKQQEDSLNEINKKLCDYYDFMNKDIAARITENINKLETLNETVKDNNGDIERSRKDIIDEMKESTAELKDLIMILINNYSTRGMKKKEKGVSGDDEGENKKEECSE